MKFLPIRHPRCPIGVRSDSKGLSELREGDPKNIVRASLAFWFLGPPAHAPGKVLHMKRKLLFATFVITVALALAGFSQSPKLMKVFLGEKLVSERARVIDGVTYAPVDDLLKPFDYKSASKGERVDLVPISGIAQRDGASGSLGVLVKGKTCSIKVLGVRPVAGYEEEWVEVYGQLFSPATMTYNLASAVAVFANGMQVPYSLSSAEMGGQAYAPLNSGESVQFVVQFKKEGGSEMERVVLTFANNKNDTSDVFRIRVKD